MMRLLLCSYRLGGHSRTLRSLARGARAAVIPNAGDRWPVSTEHRDREANDLADAGFDVSVLDLRGYFGKSDDLRRELAELDAVWVPGGNTFVLARAMNASGFRGVAGELIRAGDLVYAGYSAGACATGPDLDGIHLMDEPDVLPAGYGADWATDTLGLLPWRIVPHWRSNHREAGLAETAVEYLLNKQLPFQTLQDGRAVLVDGEHSSVI